MKEFHLEDIPVRFHQKKDAPIYIRVQFLAGSRFDEKEGTAHFLEHMMCAGSQKFTTKNLLAEYIEAVGGNFALSTSSDYINIDIQVPTKDEMKIAVVILDEMVNHSLFEPATLETERGSILSEQVIAKNAQRSYIHTVFKKLAYQKTDIAKNVLGTKESVMTITTEDLKKHRTKYIHRQTLKILVVGDISEEELIKEMRGINWATGPCFIVVNLPIVANQLFVLEIYNSKEATLRAGFRLSTFDIKNRICGDILAEFLGSSRSGILSQELRYKRGLIYSASAHHFQSIDGGTFSVTTSTEVKNFAEVLSVIKQIIEDLIAQGIPASTLKYIKSKILKSMKIDLQTSKAWVNYIENYDLEETSRYLEDISEGDIKNYINQNFAIDKFFVAVCGPEDLRMILEK